MLLTTNVVRAKAIPILSYSTLEVKAKGKHVSLSLGFLSSAKALLQTRSKRPRQWRGEDRFCDVAHGGDEVSSGTSQAIRRRHDLATEHDYDARMMIRTTVVSTE